jgi:hypothetical protein
VHIDLEDSVGDLTVVIKPTAGAQELAVSGSLAVVLVGESNHRQSFATDQIEEILETVAMLVGYSLLCDLGAVHFG